MPVRARAFERRVVSAARDDQSVLHVLHARTIAAGNPVPLICDTNFDPLANSPARLPHGRRFLSLHLPRWRALVKFLDRHPTELFSSDYVFVAWTRVSRSFSSLSSCDRALSFSHHFLIFLLFLSFFLLIQLNRTCHWIVYICRRG